MASDTSGGPVAGGGRENDRIKHRTMQNMSIRERCEVIKADRVAERRRRKFVKHVKP